MYGEMLGSMIYMGMIPYLNDNVGILRWTLNHKNGYNVVEPPFPSPDHQSKLGYVRSMYGELQFKLSIPSVSNWILANTYPVFSRLVFPKRSAAPPSTPSRQNWQASPLRI
jgi:hypothetical protein